MHRRTDAKIDCRNEHNSLKATSVVFWTCRCCNDLQSSYTFRKWFPLKSKIFSSSCINSSLHQIVVEKTATIEISLSHRIVDDLLAFGDFVIWSVSRTLSCVENTTTLGGLLWQRNLLENSLFLFSLWC